MFMDNFLIDSHAHILDGAFDADRDAVLQASFDAGVKQIIEIGCNTDEWLPALALCAAYPRAIYAVLGLHPEFAGNFSEEKFNELKNLLTREEVVGIGEIGLDYFHEPFSKEQQQMVFEQVLSLTREIKKPAVLHIRKSKAETDFSAYQDTFNILKKYSSPGVLHCFSGRYEDAVRAVDMGYFLGINAIITYKKNEDLRSTVKKIGLKHILLETDCPYLPPQSKRGTRNSPANIPEFAQFMADYLNLNLDDLAAITSANCQKLFSI